MPTTAIASFIFVDFENVPHADFSVLKDERVKVTLLIGAKNNLSEFPDTAASPNCPC